VTPVTETSTSADFEDLLAANRRFAESFALTGFDGVAHAGVAMVTCMDSRIDPLGMIGLTAGDAKILRNPGGRVDDGVLVALVVGVNLLGVDRVLVVQHTRCAMASATEPEMRDRLAQASGHDASWMSFGVMTDQRATLRDDVAKVRAHPLIDDHVLVGGFMYDVDTGLLQPVD
jgi:carbonic anhydrase